MASLVTFSAITAWPVIGKLESRVEQLVIVDGDVTKDMELGKDPETEGAGNVAPATVLV